MGMGRAGRHAGCFACDQLLCMRVCSCKCWPCFCLERREKNARSRTTLLFSRTRDGARYYYTARIPHSALNGACACCRWCPS
jgi:hypothetical protein